MKKALGVNMKRGIDRHRYYATTRIKDTIPARTGYLNNSDLEYLLKSEKDRRESEYSFGPKIGFTKVEYWGTKWSARIDDIDLDEYHLKFWCNTAWCPPNELLQHIADKYKVQVECFYEIEGYGDEGVGKDTFVPDFVQEKI